MRRFVMLPLGGFTMLFALAAAGCGPVRPPVTEVEGVVLLNGQPLPDAEVEFLSRVLPGRDPDALRQWAITMGSRPFDYRVVAKVLPTEEERWKGLRFAARMAWKDGVLVIVEVKARTTYDAGAYAVTPMAQERIARAALVLAGRWRLNAAPIRFDLVVIGL